MVYENQVNCPICEGLLRHIGSVKRIVRYEYGQVRWERVRRMRCRACGIVHRELPLYLLPHKHYEADIIRGFRDGSLSSEDLRFEDYPSEVTVQRWERMTVRL